MDRHHAVFPSHQQQRKQVRHRAQASSAMEFFNVLTGPELLEVTEAHLPAHRERLYPPTVRLAMFLRQVLEEDRSCQRAVNAWAAARAAEGLSRRSIRTGAYCRARARLPHELGQALTRETGRLLCGRSKDSWRWRGRAVKLLDGTSFSMPDTPENQAAYLQSRNQAQGVGFPLARLAGVICLATGALIDAAVGPFTGKGHGELGLSRGLLGALSPGDVMLADALYCHYFLIATLGAAGVDVLFEQNGARATDFRRGRRLGPRDHRVTWLKPKTRPKGMSETQYASFPEELCVRELKVGGRVLVTTMLDPRKVRKGELAALYARRWNVELDLRNIKTTLGMELLSCRTPAMVEKELWVYLLAYNLIRLLMAQAAATSGRHPRSLSFKHTVQLWTEWTAHCPQNAGAPDAGFFLLIAQVQVGNRPHRIEPRARKRRPKPYPWLKVPRAEAHRQLRRYAHLINALSKCHWA